MNCFQFRSMNKLKCLFKKQLIEENNNHVRFTIAIIATSSAVRRNTGNVYELLLFMNLSILGNRDFKLQDL